MKIYRFILLALLLTNVKGVVEISPSVISPVCQIGDQLELTCNTSGLLQTWQLIANLDSGVVTRLRQVSSIGSTGVDSEPLTINSTIMITFSRLSSQGSFPLISRMTINPVTEGLNGARVNCVDDASSESATTTIHIIRGTQNPELSIVSHSEQFTRDGVIIVLEWIYSTLVSYYQQLLQNVSVNVVPDIGQDAVFIGNMSIQITLPYNSLYNVSITQPGICGQPNQTICIQQNYSKCTNPMELTNALAVGYEDPALEGQNITFTCAPEQVLHGSNQSTCMGNGEWEPDPGEVECIHGLGTTSTTMLTMCKNPFYVLHINNSVEESPKFDATHMCCSGFLIARANTTTCLENGEWELETLQTKSEETPNLDNVSLRPVLISVSCLLVVVSVLMFIIGLFCGCCLSQRWQKLTQHKQSMSTSHATEDFELKENEAYVTLHPK